MEKASVCCLITDGERQMTQIYILSIFTTFTKFLFSFLFFSFLFLLNVPLALIFFIKYSTSIVFIFMTRCCRFYFIFGLILSQSQINFSLVLFLGAHPISHTLTLSLKTPRNQQSLVLACFCLYHNLSFLSYTTQHFRRRGAFRKTNFDFYSRIDNFGIFE